VPVDSALLFELLRKLVAIDSVNCSLVPGANGEAAAAEFLRDFLAENGIPATLEEAAPAGGNSRPNVVARIEPEGARAGDRPALAILAHIDTVGAGNMPEPFTPRERNGRMYGRGALDIKSGVAAMCAAAIAVKQGRMALRRPLLIAAVVDEECNSIGTEALLRKHSAGAAVVLEPTDLKLVIAHKGYAWFEITTHGRAAHGSLPGEGRDAIRMMGCVLGALDSLERELTSRALHTLLGHGSLHASLIEGGQELSSYPAACRLKLERRMLPAESAAAAEEELHAMLLELETHVPEFRATLRGLGARPGFEIPRDAPVAVTASQAIREVIGAADFTGMAAWTDTALLAEAGIPGVVFGPSGRGLHGADEYVDLDSVRLCAEILHRLILKLCHA